MSTPGTVCRVSSLLKRKSTATVRANQENPASMRVSARFGTEGKVRANCRQSEGKLKMMKVFNYLCISTS